MDDVIASLKAQQQFKSPVKSPNKSESCHGEVGQVMCELQRPSSNHSQEVDSVTAYNPEKEDIMLVSLPSSVHPASDVHASDNVTKLSPSVSKVHSMSTTHCDLLLCKVLSPKRSLCSTPVRMELCLTKVKSPNRSGQLTPVRKRRMESLLSENLVKRLCQSDSES